MAAVPENGLGKFLLPSLRPPRLAPAPPGTLGPLRTLGALQIEAGVSKGVADAPVPLPDPVNPPPHEAPPPARPRPLPAPHIFLPASTHARHLLGGEASNPENVVPRSPPLLQSDFPKPFSGMAAIARKRRCGRGQRGNLYIACAERSRKSLSGRRSPSAAWDLATSAYKVHGPVDAPHFAHSRRAGSDAGCCPVGSGDELRSRAGAGAANNHAAGQPISLLRHSHPRSRKRRRSAPGGAYQPPAL